MPPAFRLALLAVVIHSAAAVPAAETEHATDDGDGAPKTTNRMTFYIGGDFEDKRFGSLGHVAQCTMYGDKHTIACYKMGEGLRGGRVYDIVAKSKKEVYATGSFADHEVLPPIQFLARWDGFKWHDVGGGLSGGVGRALAIKGDNLYVVGDFTKAGKTHALFAAMWDGNEWSALQNGKGSTSGLGGKAHALAVMSKGSVIVGGPFPTVLGDTLQQYLSVWSNKRQTWIQPQTLPFTLPVTALTTGRDDGAEAEALFAATNSDVHRYDYVERKWNRVFKRPRHLGESEFKVSSLAVQNFTIEAQGEGQAEVAQECLWIAGSFYKGTPTRNSGKEYEVETGSVIRWCRAFGGAWDAPESRGSTYFNALASSANAEVIGVHERGIMVWGQESKLVNEFRLKGAVHAVAILWEPKAKLEDDMDGELEVDTEDEESEAEATSHEGGEASEKKKERFKIRRKGEKGDLPDGIRQVAESNKMGLKVVGSWDAVDTPATKLAKKGRNIRNVANKRKRDGIDIETEEEESTRVNFSGQGEDSDSEDDSIVIDRDELLKVEQHREKMQREEKEARMLQRRYDTSILYRLCKRFGLDIQPRINIDTLEWIDDSLNTTFFMSQMVTMFFLTWGLSTMLDRIWPFTN